MHVPAATVVFLITYAGVALGGFPGLAIDRTGVALLGAVAMVLAGGLTPTAALGSLDAPTLALLYGLMVVSAQLRLGGFYTRVAWRLGRLAVRPRRFLLLLMLASAGLSALLVNDIVCLAFTPVVLLALRPAGLHPMPFLLGLALASNIGSAATIIGNPQNMLIGQTGRLDFAAFLLWCLPPVALSLAAAYAILLGLYRRVLPARVDLPAAAADTVTGGDEQPPYDGWRSRKGLAAVAIVLACFFVLPAGQRAPAALAVAALLLISRRLETRRLLAQVDWHLITLFCGLFVVVQGFAATGLPLRAMTALQRAGLSLRDAVTLTWVAAASSNVVSNVPAVMLLVRFLEGAPPQSWYVLALASTFAGNLITLGSIANLIVIEQARQMGVTLSFREHARVGVPVTLVSLLFVLLWSWGLPCCTG